MIAAIFQIDSMLFANKESLFIPQHPPELNSGESSDRLYLFNNWSIHPPKIKNIPAWVKRHC